jgi:hypothetical protein
VTVLTVVMVVVGGLLMLAALKADDGGDWGGVVFVAGGLIGIVGLFLLIPMAVNRLGVGGEMAGIDALRSAVQHVELFEGHDVYGKAADMNQLIASNRWYRRQWWGRDFVAAEWDTVSLIQFPGRRRGIEPRQLP